MITIKTPGRWRGHAQDIHEFLTFLEANPTGWRKNFRGYTTTTDPAECGREWDMNTNWEQTLRLARQGWPEGARMMDERLEGRLPSNHHMTSWRYDIAGELPDIGRYVSGMPDVMRHRGGDKGKRPVVAIHVNVWIRCDVKASHMANYGAAMVQAIDTIENTGRRVELTAGVTAPHCRTNTIMSATWGVKRAEEDVDLGALAFSLAHPAASRRFGWAAWERSGEPSDQSYGRGVGYKVKEDDLIDPVPGVLLITGLNSDPRRAHDMKDARALVCEQINAAAGEELVTLPEQEYA